MKYVRWLAMSVIVDASGLLAHDGASSPPTRHPNGSAHVGQPVPTYNAVLLRVSPHVVSVRVPPSVALSPNDSMYTRRLPV